jgi:tripartite ATP-independent transporter DctP family solute receptor
MLKNGLAFLLISMCLVGFAYADGGGETAANSSTAKSIELGYGLIHNPGHDIYIAVEKFSNAMKEQSKGVVTIKMYPSSQVGTEREMVEQVIMGTLEITQSNPAGWQAGLNLPEIGVWGLPFLYDSLEGQKRLIEQIALTEFQKMLIPKGIHPMFIFSNGIRNCISKTKPIKGLADLSGLKMRAPENPLYTNTWKNLGASIVIVPWSEVYTALSQGVCDAAEADAVGMVNSNLHEVTKYYSRTAHMGDLLTVVMNEKIWQTMTPEIQQLFLNVGAACSTEQIGNRKKSDDVAEKTISDAGVQMFDVDAAELAKMRAAVRPMYDEYARLYNQRELIDKILTIAGGK